MTWEGITRKSVAHLNLVFQGTEVHSEIRYEQIPDGQNEEVQKVGAKLPED